MIARLRTDFIAGGQRRDPPRAWLMMAHVLVVDDDASLLAAVCRLLRSAGYDARGVGGGAAAVVAMRADLPALVLLDWAMPGLFGPGALRAARADPAAAGV